jgi:hypothetical protein
MRSAILRCCFLTGLTLGAGLASSRGQAVDTPDGKTAQIGSATVEQLLAKLADRDYPVREAAARELATKGVEALPALQNARKSADPEVRRRLDELVPPLERKLALAPRLVTLHMVDRPLRDALAELTRQTGYKVGAWEGDQQLAKDRNVFTFHLDKIPFWQALDQVCEAGGLILQQNFGDDTLRVIAQDSYVPFASYNGPFRVVATGFTYNRNNSFSAAPRLPTLSAGGVQNEFLQLGITLTAEPKLPIVRVGQVRIVSAVDDEERSMAPPVSIGPGDLYNRRYYYGGNFRSYQHAAQVQLILPSRNARYVKRVQGVIPVTLVSDQKAIVVTDHLLTAKGKKFKVGNATFGVEDVSEMPGKQYQISLKVTEDAAANNADTSQWQTLQQRLQVQDDKGNTRQIAFTSVGRSGAGTSQFTFILQQTPGQNQGNPNRLLYTAWDTMDHEITFEFRDLPLP